MLYMVVETFLKGAGPVGERVKSHGRLLPEGVTYHQSWLEPGGTRCFQLMEAESLEAFDPWIAHWADLVHFEINPVLTSQEFWTARAAAERAGRG